MQANTLTKRQLHDDPAKEYQRSLYNAYHPDPDQPDLAKRLRYSLYL